MSRLFGANATLGQSEPIQRVDSRDQNGRIMIMRDSFTFLVELANGDDIVFGRKLPRGAKVIQAILDTPIIAGLTDLDLGWLDNGTDGVDLDGLLDGLDANAGAFRTKMNDSQGRPGQDKQFTEDVEIIVTANAGPSTNAIGKTMKVEIHYAMN